MGNQRREGSPGSDLLAGPDRRGSCERTQDLAEALNNHSLPTPVILWLTPDAARQLRGPGTNLPVPETTRFRSSHGSAPPHPPRLEASHWMIRVELHFPAAPRVARTWRGASRSWRTGASLLLSVFQVGTQRKRLSPVWPPSSPVSSAGLPRASPQLQTARSE